MSIGNYEFINAVDMPDNPALGCLLSHKEIIERAMQRRSCHVIILEDDTELITDFNDLVQGYINQLPEDWDMFYFGANNKKPAVKVAENIGRCVKTSALSAYVVKKRVYKFILGRISAHSNLHIDEIFINHIHPHINAYTAIPNLCYQRAGYSDIEKQNVDYKHCYDHPLWN